MEVNQTQQAIQDVQELRRELFERPDNDLPSVAGFSMLFGKKKEILEEKYGLKNGPNFLTGTMIFLLILLEMSLMATVVLLFFWNFEIRKGSFDLGLFAESFGQQKLLENTETFTPNKTQDSRSEELYKIRITHHITIYSSIFLLALPHVEILRILFQNGENLCLQSMVVILKLGSLLTFLVGWYDIRSRELVQNARDCGTHAYFSKITLIILFFYNIVTIVRIMGRMFGSVYTIRFVGGFLRQIVTQKFENLIQQLCSISALTSMLTGIIAFMFYIKHKHGIEHESQEFWVIRSSIILLVGSFVLHMVVSIMKHYISHHKSCISIEQFQEFVKLEEKWHRCKNWEDRSKITRPVIRN